MPSNHSRIAHGVTSPLVGVDDAQVLSNKTIAGGILTAPTITGGTIVEAVLSGGTSIEDLVTTGISTKGGLEAAAGSSVAATKVKDTLADNTVVDAYTVTSPNAIHGGSIRLHVAGTLGDGDSTDSKFYIIGISRVAGAATKAVISTATAVGATAGVTANATTTASVTAMTGAVDATQTFTIQVKVARSAGASTGHVCSTEATLLNNFATGITIAAAV